MQVAFSSGGSAAEQPDRGEVDHVGCGREEREALKRLRDLLEATRSALDDLVDRVAP